MIDDPEARRDTRDARRHDDRDGERRDQRDGQRHTSTSCAIPAWTSVTDTRRNPARSYIRNAGALPAAVTTRAESTPRPPSCSSAACSKRAPSPRPSARAATAIANTSAAGSASASFAPYRHVSQTCFGARARAGGGGHPGGDAVLEQELPVEATGVLGDRDESADAVAVPPRRAGTRFGTRPCGGTSGRGTAARATRGNRREIRSACRAATEGTSARAAGRTPSPRSGDGSVRTPARSSRRAYVDRVRSMQRCWSNSRSALSRAARPMRARSSRSSASVAIASASAAGSRTGTRRPVTPSSTACRQPRMSVATRARPSRRPPSAHGEIPRGAKRARACPSRDTERIDVVALAEEPHARRCGQLAVVVGQAVGLVDFVGPDRRRSRTFGTRGAQHARPLRTPRGTPSRGPAGRRHRRRRRRGRPHRAPARAVRTSSSVDARRVEPPEIDAVAEDREPRLAERPAGAAPEDLPRSAAARRREHAAATRSSPYTTARFAARVLGERVEPVHRVDDDRDTSARVPRRVRTARASGCGCARSPGRNSRNTRTSSTSARRVLERRHAPRSRAAARRGGRRAPRAPRRTDRAPTRRRRRTRAHPAARSCGPSSSSRLMSVVVTWTTTRPRRAVTWLPPRSGAGSRRRRSVVLETPCRRRALRTNQRCPSLAWTGERASRYGSVAPIGLGRVPATAAERNRARTARSAAGEPSSGLRVREVDAARARHARRSSAIDRSSSSSTSASGSRSSRRCAVRVRTDVDPAGRDTRRGAPPTTAACRRPGTRCPGR